MEELAYSFHLGIDKNRKPTSKNLAKNNQSGTTSMNNNAIQTATTLSKVDKHNYRKYDDRQDEIVIVRGSSSLYNDVKDLYLREFEEARLEYNEKQKRNDRKIKDYFANVSNNTKSDLACEIIIELGNKRYWDTKNMDFKKKMTKVFTKQVSDLELLVPNFKIASAIIHYDETSPHLHIVGVPIKYKNKNGMSKQVGKSDVFTKTSLIKLQDEMRTLCIEEFNKEYKLNTVLKEKKKGKNQDINVKDMEDYLEMQEQLDRNQKNLEKIKEESTSLKDSTNEIKDIVNDLKPTLMNKNNYTIKQQDKDKLIKYFDKVDKVNNSYNKIHNLYSSLLSVNDKLKDNRNTIKELTENNKALELRVNKITKKLIEQDNAISDLKEENNHLKNIINKLENFFNKFKNFIKDRLFSSKETSAKYYDITYDMYSHGVIDKDTMIEFKDEYDDYKEYLNNKSKHHDDFEL